MNVPKPVIKKPKDVECLHLLCPECRGTGKKKDGTICIHMISCSCLRCNPHSL